MIFAVILLQTALILAALRIVIRKLNNMPTRADLDAALASLGTSLDQLTAAIQQLPHPGDEDFTPEIQAVTDAAAKVAADIAALQQPPPQP
jgi:hypothetical protein